MWQFFKHLDISLALTLFEPFSTQITISFKPHHFQAKSLQNLFKVRVSNTIFIFYFQIIQNLWSRFWKLGIFENWVGFPIFAKNFSISLLGLVPFEVCVSVLDPCGNLNLYWGMFHHVHAFFIVFINCCMLGVWQNVQVTFFGCIGLKWVPLLEFPLIELVSHALDVFNLLCSQMPCLAHTVHTLGISRHTSCTSRCTHKHHQMH